MRKLQLTRSWYCRRRLSNFTTRLIDKAVKMIDKDAEIACEYVVPPAVGYDRSHGHLVNLYNAFIVIYNK